MRAARFPLIALLAAGGVLAASLEVTVRDERGNPVENAVAYATPKGAPAPAGPKRTAAIEQIDKTFVPHVTVVQTGTTVQFPNRDPIRHHVYSFSPAKSFEIKLYAGTPPTPVLFDKPGEVVLGCNIHDNMLSYLYVTTRPLYAVTDGQGRATFRGLGAGTFTSFVWHPDLKDDRGERPGPSAELGATEARELSLRDEMRAARRTQLPPREGAYR